MERINRKDDEKWVYQPKIHSKRIKQLYILKEGTGIPMTVLLDEAINYYLQDYGKIKSKQVNR